MRSSLRPVRLPILLTTIAVVVGTAFTTGASAAVAADDEQAPAAYAIGAVESDSRAASVADPLSDIADDADAALAAARTAMYFAAATQRLVADSGLTVEGSATIDTTALSSLAEQLSQHQLTPLMLLPKLVTDTIAETDAVTRATSDLSARLDEAVAVQRAAEAAAAAAKAAEEAAEKAKAEAAAKKAAAEKAAREKAAREAAASASVSAGRPAASGDNSVAGARATAQSMGASKYGWGSDQFSCLVSLWKKESGWNYQAYNASSGAYGIPQALPGSKMASAGSDWKTSAATQISWGLSYISNRYGTPCGAWDHSQSVGWY